MVILSSDFRHKVAADLVGEERLRSFAARARGAYFDEHAQAACAPGWPASVLPDLLN